MSLAGYSAKEIMKMGRWKSATFMEYIREELDCFSAGMSENMKKRFEFVNVSGDNVYDMTTTLMAEDYNVNRVGAAAA